MIDGTTDLVLLLELQGRPERHIVLRTTTYNVRAVQELIEDDKELASGERQLAVESLVLHHCDRAWNAPKDSGHAAPFETAPLGTTG